MTWLYFTGIVFSALTVFFTYTEYKHNRLPRKTFAVISIIEVIVIIATSVLMTMSI